MVADPANNADAGKPRRASLKTFMGLPVAQRSSVILMDVLGYSLDEISAVTDTTVPAVKAALHRGRAQTSRTCRPAGRNVPCRALADTEQTSG